MVTLIGQKGGAPHTQYISWDRAYEGREATLGPSMEGPWLKYYRLPLPILSVLKLRLTILASLAWPMFLGFMPVIR